MIERCPKSSSYGEECPYYNMRPRKKLRKEGETTGCYADNDHEVPQKLLKAAGCSALLMAYIKSDANQTQMCRWEHDQKTERDDYVIPPIWMMLEALRREGWDGER